MKERKMKALNEEEEEKFLVFYQEIIVQMMV
jgi:hypothetical protein